MSSNKVRVAIIGVGNCASSLVQGVQFYRNAPEDEQVPGLMHVNLGGYHIRDIEFSAAFDVVESKVGLDLSEAIFAEPNNTIKFADVPNLDVRVKRGMTHDGLGKYVSTRRQEGARLDRRYRQDSARHRHRCGGQLPAGRLGDGDQVVCRADPGGRLRLHQLHPGVHRLAALLGASASPIASCRSSATTSRARSARRSPTACWRTCSASAACKLDRTYQLNFGGNMDFYNMLERERLESKKISKTGAVTSQLDYQLPADDVHVGPSDYVPWLTDRKWCLHPHGGHDLRQCAAERRDEAGGLG